jgi:hypothetical protein
MSERTDLRAVTVLLVGGPWDGERFDLADADFVAPNGSELTVVTREEEFDEDWGALRVSGTRQYRERYRRVGDGDVFEHVPMQTCIGDPHPTPYRPEEDE